jgi:FKBP-type peptidyl-prolyl cis-trans isomerase
VVLITLCVNAFLLVIPSCTSADKQSVGTLSEDQVNKEDLIRVNKGMMKGLSADIEAFCDRHGYNMNLTPTGLRYMIYDSSGTGPHATTDMAVTVKFSVSLLDGREIYTSDVEGPLVLVIDRSEIATGFQEGLKYMSEGDKAIMIIPAHLAYGITGDGEKIGHYKAIVVDTELIKVEETNEIQ